jgi:hypothetical protein
VGLGFSKCKMYGGIFPQPPKTAETLLTYLLASLFFSPRQAEFYRNEARKPRPQHGKSPAEVVVPSTSRDLGGRAEYAGVHGGHHRGRPWHP